MANNTVYFITGGNRGIGLGLVKTFLARPNTTVIATVRNDQAMTLLKGETMSPGENSTLHILQLDLTTAPEPTTIREILDKEVPGLDHIDVLINNAAVIPPMSRATETSMSDLRRTFETNTYAPLMIFQAVWPLLQKSTAAPKVIMITSSVGSITEQEPVPGGAYGPSKVALNWLTRALHLENESAGLIAVALHPGWVQTAAGFFSASEWGFAAGPPQTLEDSVVGVVKVVDEATRDNYSGRFVTYTGDFMQW